MRKVRLSAVFVFVVVAHAHAFDNIEADAAYNGPIKTQIEGEFVQGLTMLKAQAERLNMDVREKDLLTLQEHMFEKAMLMGGCVDEAVTAQKKTTKQLDVADFAKRCVDKHLKFMARFIRGESEGREMSLCEMKTTNPHPMDPYPFLKLPKLRFFTRDYIALKKCEHNPAFLK